MTLNHDPFAKEMPGRTETKKRAFLVGRGRPSKKVHFLAKVALYRAESINCYHLITGERRKFSGRVFRGFQAMRDEFMRQGYEIRYPSDIPENGIRRWVEHGKREAKRLGLAVSGAEPEWPFLPVDD